MRVGLYDATHLFVRTLAHVLYRAEIDGAPLPAGPVVLAANHASVLDPFFLPLVTRRPVQFLAKVELWRFRPVAAVMDAYGSVPVDRGRGDRDALARGAEVLRRGGILGVFPEGSVQGGAWQRGAAKLALVTGAPVVPVLLVGTGRALSRGRVGLPKIRIVVGDAIPVEQAKPTIAAARELTERVRSAVDALS